MNEDVRQQAEADYMSGMKYKEIAEKYSVTINTVKSWKTRYQWSRGDKKGVHTKKKKVCTQKRPRKEPEQSSQCYGAAWEQKRRETWILRQVAAGGDSIHHRRDA